MHADDSFPSRLPSCFFSSTAAQCLPPRSSALLSSFLLDFEGAAVEKDEDGFPSVAEEPKLLRWCLSSLASRSPTFAEDLDAIAL